MCDGPAKRAATKAALRRRRRLDLLRPDLAGERLLLLRLSRRTQGRCVALAWAPQKKHMNPGAKTRSNGPSPMT
jgi:hypothetical protein